MNGSSAARQVRLLLGGLVFPEGPRWHDGRLFFSDMHAREVVAVDEHGARETVVAMAATEPSGLGWLPDGRLLIVSMTDRRVLRREHDGTLSVHADLAALAEWHCNDMVVDRHGRAYVGNFGWDLLGRTNERRPASLIRVDPDGNVAVVASDLDFPNGPVITPDGSTLIIAESVGRRLSAFTIDADGSLRDRRVWAALPKGTTTDGICLDAEGAIWSACPTSGQVLRVREGGEIADAIALDAGMNAYACMLGGAERRTLLICAASSSLPHECLERRDGRILAVDVEVPGAGLP